MINNAIKFTESGGITIEATLDHYQDSICYLSFAVTDTGVGISPSNLKKLFTQFFQTEESRKQEGTGLGLSISQLITKAMGGKIEVESTVGVGTTFTVRSLPFQIISAEIDNKVTNKMIEIPQREISALRLLLAEDNNVNRMVILKMLENLGLKADIATNGLEVLEALQKSSYDLILMDMQMPEMDGLEATKVICASYTVEKRPKIIAVTASALKEDRAKCFAAGVDDYITKPIQLDELSQVLQKVGQKILA